MFNFASKLLSQQICTNLDLRSSIAAISFRSDNFSLVIFMPFGFFLLRLSIQLFLTPTTVAKRKIAA